MVSASSTARLLARRTVPLAALLFLAVLALYLRTLTQVHTFDALSYVTSIERKPWTELFHPHHLAYGPLGALVMTLAAALGYRGGAETPLQLVNAVAGALGVALFFDTAKRTTGRTDCALAAALLLGGSYAFWYYAVEIEVYTLAALFLIVCLGILVRGGGWSRRRLVVLGLAHGAATLFHQTNILLAAPVLVCAIMDLGSRGRDLSPRATSALAAWLGRWLLYVLTYAITVGLPYVYAIVVASGFRTPDAALAWLTEYARTGWWGGLLTEEKLAKLGQGLSDTLAQPGGVWAWLALGVCTLPWQRFFRKGAARKGRGADHSGYSLLPRSAPLLAWLIVYGLFFTWWEPDNVEFWIGCLPPLLLLVASRLAVEPGRWRVLAAAGVAAAMIIVNYGAITRRGDAATDLQRVIVRELAARSTPADLLLVPDGLLELYLPHYEQRENFVSLNQALFDANDDARTACALIQTRIDTALHAGATAIIADEALHPPPELLARHRVSQQQVDACFRPYRDLLTAIELPPTVPGYKRLPRADEFARGEGWRFGTFGLGWRAANVAGERFDGGWRFRPGRDGALLSPLLSLNADDYQTLEVRLANGAGARDAQLFFAGPDGRIDEARSVRWELAEGDGPVTYRVQLHGAPGWNGVISRLRLDPVGVGDGGEVRVEWVALRR